MRSEERVLQLREENAGLAAAVEEELAAVLSATKRCAEAPSRPILGLNAPSLLSLDHVCR